MSILTGEAAVPRRKEPLDALTGQEVRPGPDGRVWLPPYAAWWLVSPQTLR